jgi:hypothetical protein
VVEVSDTAYMDAVAKGDMKTAQRMVNAAAKEAGYTKKVFHGSPEEGITVFDRQVTSVGYFFSPDENTADYYTAGTGKVYEVLLKMGKTLDLTDEFNLYTAAKEVFGGAEERDEENVRGFVERLYNEGYGKNEQVTEFFNRIDGIEDVKSGGYSVAQLLSDNWIGQSEVDDLVAKIGSKRVSEAYENAAPSKDPNVQSVVEAYGSQDFYMEYQNDLLEWARANYDSVILDDPSSTGDPISYVVFNSNQIKSADPVTYDDNGNVIPLSKRFNSRSEDIRNPKRKLKRGLRKNPVVFPPDDITFAGASSTPANDAIAAGKALWDTPAFKKWFGDSKVRDLAKRPMVVYHGTCSAEFTEFDPTKTQEVGFHFGTPAQAKDFLKGCGSSRGKTPGIYPVYLSIQNPIFTPDVYSEDPVYLIEWLEKTNHIHEWFPDESDSYYRSMNRLRDQMASLKSDSSLNGKEQYEMLKPLRKATSGLLRKVIMRKGYDGIRYKNENEGRTDDPTNIAWIAFSPAQVKSATENIRTFDRRDPDIRNPRRSMIRTKLSRILEPGDRVLDYDRAQGEDLYRLWDMVHTDKPLTKEALVEIEGMLDDDGVLVIQSGEEPSGLQDHFRKATRYQGMLLVQGPLNPEVARINTEKLRRDLE